MLIKGLSHRSAGAMEQDSVVVGFDLQDLTGFLGRKPLHISHHHHGALQRRQLLDQLVNDL